MYTKYVCKICIQKYAMYTKYVYKNMQKYSKAPLRKIEANAFLFHYTKYVLLLY